jgi:hypothetical protein
MASLDFPIGRRRLNLWILRHTISNPFGNVIRGYDRKKAYASCGCDQNYADDNSQLSLAICLICDEGYLEYFDPFMNQINTETIDHDLHQANNIFSPPIARYLTSAVLRLIDGLFVQLPEYLRIVILTLASGIGERPTDRHS